MSDPLPDNLHDWPDNPFDLLGVKLGDDGLALKRAYQRLIKIYRPEQRPEEFRRIREAYDAAQSISEFVASAGIRPQDEAAEQPADAASAANGTTPAEAAASSPDQPSKSPASIEPAYERRLAEAWESVKAGRMDAAYRALDALRQEQPARHEAYLASYWLLRMAPSVDSQRHACDMLALSIERADGARDAALELYRRELERNPEESLSERAAKLLRETLVRGPAFVVADYRWQAAASRRDWKLIGDDLAALRAAVAAYDHDAWLRLLWSAVECVCWFDDRPAKTFVEDGVRELEREGAAQASRFDALMQLDFLLETAAAVKKLRAEIAPTGFCELIQRSWAVQALDLYVGFSVFMTQWAADPGALVEYLTAAAEKGPAALSRFGQLLSQFEQETERNLETFWTPELARPIVIDFFVLHGYLYGADLRRELLEFCLYQQLSPEQVAECLDGAENIRQRPSRQVIEALAADWPLHYAYRAMRLLAS